MLQQKIPATVITGFLGVCMAAIMTGIVASAFSNQVARKKAAFEAQLREVFKERVLGPEFPIIKRIQNKFLKEIKLKIERSAPDKKVKARILQDLDAFYQNVRFKGIQISIDVDPM